MNPVELIRKKRDGKPLQSEELRFFFTEYQKGRVLDYQVSAMLMAMYFHPLDRDELNALCDTMIHSGRVLNLSSVTAPKIDKHSTGGVGDKTSLIVAPIVASLGVAVPMISGRGLGHTGGTLDKLESIPGFNIHLSAKQFVTQLKQIRCALIGQTKEIAPLDKLLYSLRDVTATVDSIPLIAASIMSKKIASGLDGLVLDVKTGVGAFMQTPEGSRTLAQTLIQIGESYGKKVTAFITDMNEPLGNAVGNWLEVKECVACVQGHNVPDLMEVSHTLAGEMLRLAGKCETLEEGIEMSVGQIRNGQAFQKLLEIVKAQGGDEKIVKNPERGYPKASYCTARIVAGESGWISEINALEIGMCAVELGAGRTRKEDSIDPKAGLLFHKKVGDRVMNGDLIAELFTDAKAALDRVAERAEKVIKFSSMPVSKHKKVVEKI
ncbi:MAG: thymidine phosphorylase [Chlorobiales bacterium]|nr:thymidine phosphorylase [Chlorobiales bacterium]